MARALVVFLTHHHFLIWYKTPCERTAASVVILEPQKKKLSGHKLLYVFGVMLLHGLPFWCLTLHLNHESSLTTGFHVAFLQFSGQRCASSVTRISQGNLQQIVVSPRAVCGMLPWRCTCGVLRTVFRSIRRYCHRPTSPGSLRVE